MSCQKGVSHFENESKDPGETIPLVFDFGPGLATGETLTSKAIVVTVVGGVDGSPTAILAGGDQFDATNTKVYVPVTGGLDGVDYNIKVTCATTNPKKVLVLAGVLEVRSVVKE